VRNERLDILAANPLGEALYSPVFGFPHRPVNTARFAFLDPRATEFFVDWDTIASDAVAILRAAAGRDPYDKRLTDLVGELSTRSEEFRVRWAAHNVKFHRTGSKRLHHPIVGELTLTLRSARAGRRSRPATEHLHRRTGLPVKQRAQPARFVDHDTG
jgi:MmyB-like transcription regulator ligand binding domain